MIKVEMTFANVKELSDFLNGTAVAIGNGIVATSPSRLAAAADAGIPVQEVKKGPGRPRKESPAAPAPVAKPAPATPAPEPIDEAVEPVETTFEDYKTFMTGAFTGGHRGIVLEVLGEYGAAKISAISADKYDEVIAQVNKRIEEAS